MRPAPWQRPTQPVILPTQSVISSGSRRLYRNAALVVRAYLDAWKAEDYHAMYALLTSLSRDALSEDEFVRHYQSVTAEAVLKPGADGIAYEIKSVMVNPGSPPRPTTG